MTSNLIIIYLAIVQVWKIDAILLAYWGETFAHAFFFLNHGFSYFYNKKEMTNISQAIWGFVMPYIRNIPMHIIVAGVAIFSGAGTWAIVFFLLLKMMIDLGAHIFEHKFTPNKVNI